VPPTRPRPRFSTAQQAPARNIRTTVSLVQQPLQLASRPRIFPLATMALRPGFR
jgi:hypothetical protein